MVGRYFSQSLVLIHLAASEKMMSKDGQTDGWRRAMDDCIMTVALLCAVAQSRAKNTKKNTVRITLVGKHPCSHYALYLTKSHCNTLPVAAWQFLKIQHIRQSVHSSGNNDWCILQCTALWSEISYWCTWSHFQLWSLTRTLLAATKFNAHKQNVAAYAPRCLPVLNLTKLNNRHHFPKAIESYM